MSELGTRLKEARIAKGYSLEDLQDLTKIQKRYLAGIEEGNHSMMPGPFYARAFIKQYAESVGLNADELLEQHKSEVPVPVKEELKKPLAPSTPSRRQTFAKSSSRGVGEVMPKVIVALFIVLILGVSWYFYKSLDTNDTAEEVPEETAGVPYEEPAEEETPPPAEEKPAEAPAEEKPEEPKEPEAAIKVKGTQGETTTYEWSGPAKRELTIKASGASWVSATDQAQKELLAPARTMQPNESEKIDVSSASQVRIRLGASPNVQLAVNGKPIEYSQDLITQNIVIQFTAAE